MIRCGVTHVFQALVFLLKAVWNGTPVPFRVFPAFSPQRCVAAACVAKPVLGNKSSVDRVMSSYT